MNQLFKPFICIVLVTVGCNISVGQSLQQSRFKPTEVGINLFHYTAFTVYNNETLKSFSGSMMPRVGITLKKHVKVNSALRFSINYVTRASHRQDNGGATFHYDIKKTERSMDLTLGLERHISGGRISTYIFTDLFQNVGRRHRNGYYAGCWDAGKFDDSHHFYQVGLTPGFGMKLKLSQRFALNVETNTRLISEFNTVGHYNTLNPRFQMSINPISRFSLNYRL
ncbi:MAG: hypothetical protein ACI9JN_001879 [Bacteroidia bacterium]|jgi:hypothetical protein